jgi:parvulin-like peptidyl-prolyl cis-trans isomerase-like protein
MLKMVLIFVLAVGAIAQSQERNPGLSSDRPQSEKAAQSLKSVQLKDPVITVPGLCRDNRAKAGDSAACKTIVTREQFERLIAALKTAGQPVPENGLPQLAQAYVDLLAYEEAARPTADSPEFRDLMDLIRLRTLSEIHRRSLQAKYSTPSPQDIDAYYSQHIANFTDLKLHRILIPRRKPSSGGAGDYEKEALKVANDSRERAAQGAEFDQLQKQAYAALGLPSPPGTDMGVRRITNLLPEVRDEILALSAGGLSKVEQETYSFVIYRVDEKSVLPKEAVKDEISREISRERLESALKEITSRIHPDFNELYFPPAPPANPSASAPTASQQVSKPLQE